MELIVIFLIVLLVFWIWLIIIGIVAVKHDVTLDAFQKKAQIALILLVPLFGVVLVLHLVNQHSPEAIPIGIVPWPIKSLIVGNKRLKNQDRDSNMEPAMDLPISRAQDRSYSSNVGSDAGGGGGGD